MNMEPRTLPSSHARVDTRRSQYQDIKGRVHEILLNRLDLKRLSQVEQRHAEPEIRLIGGILERETEHTPLSLAQRDALRGDVLNEVFGLGPIEALRKDPTVSDILVNRFDQIYVERNGILERTDATFKDNRHLLRIIERIVRSVGRRIDES